MFIWSNKLFWVSIDICLYLFSWCNNTWMAKYSDMEITCDDADFFVNICILSKSSPLFEKLKHEKVISYQPTFWKQWSTKKVKSRIKWRNKTWWNEKKNSVSVNKDNLIVLYYYCGNVLNRIKTTELCTTNEKEICVIKNKE